MAGLEAEARASLAKLQAGLAQEQANIMSVDGVSKSSLPCM